MNITNKIILKNINGKATVSTIFRGKKIVLKPKHSLTLDKLNEEHRELSHYLTYTYGFVIDITSHFEGGDK